MLFRKKKLGYWFFLISFFIISGCNTQKTDNTYSLLLTGESENWNLTGYEIVITPEKFKVGNGTLTMKNEHTYLTDSFHFDTHININGEDIVVHAGSSTGRMNLAEETTGAIDGKVPLNKNGNSITLNDINEIYLVVEWQDIGSVKSGNERIDLYHTP